MSDVKIKIQNLYKIFGKNPEAVLEIVKNGISKDELLEKHNHVLGLNNINLNIYPKSIQVIMGLSGSGKSTLIRHVNRLIEPTFGSITVDSEDVLKMSELELRNFRRSKTAMVFQRFALLPHKTVLQNTVFGLHIQNRNPEEAKKIALRWIERVGLSGYEDKYPQHLSGGMQQRVGLARALTNDGDILLMDEAFSALDPLIRKDMQDILLELQAELHKTVIFITHDLDEALKIGDRIAILVEDVNRARVIKAKHIMSEINGQDISNAMPINQDEFIDRFIDKVIAEKPENLLIQDKNQKNVGIISSKRLSEILKR